MSRICQNMIEYAYFHSCSSFSLFLTCFRLYGYSGPEWESNYLGKPLNFLCLALIHQLLVNCDFIHYYSYFFHYLMILFIFIYGFAKYAWANLPWLLETPYYKLLVPGNRLKSLDAKPFIYISESFTQSVTIWRAPFRDERIAQDPSQSFHQCLDEFGVMSVLISFCMSGRDCL